MNPLFKKPFFVANFGHVKRALFAEDYSCPIAEIRATPQLPGCVLDEIAQFLASAPLMYAALEKATATINTILDSDDINVATELGIMLDALDVEICRAIDAAKGVDVNADIEDQTTEVGAQAPALHSQQPKE